MELVHLISVICNKFSDIRITVQISVIKLHRSLIIIQISANDY